VVEPLPVAEYMLCEIHWQRSSSARHNCQAVLEPPPGVGSVMADEELQHIFNTRHCCGVQTMLPTSSFEA
jgi:hypothetical protein